MDYIWCLLFGLPGFGDFGCFVGGSGTVLDFGVLRCFAVFDFVCEFWLGVCGFIPCVGLV